MFRVGDFFFYIKFLNMRTCVIFDCCGFLRQLQCVQWVWMRWEVIGCRFHAFRACFKAQRRLRRCFDEGRVVDFFATSNFGYYAVPFNIEGTEPSPGTKPPQVFGIILKFILVGW